MSFLAGAVAAIAHSEGFAPAEPGVLKRTYHRSIGFDFSVKVFNIRLPASHVFELFRVRFPSWFKMKVHVGENVLSIGNMFERRCNIFSTCKW